MSPSPWGWAALILLVVQILPFLLRRIMKGTQFSKSAGYRSMMVLLTRSHPWIGALLIAVAVTHGLLSFGTLLVFHTGPVLFTSMLLTACLGAGFRLLKKSNLLKAHRLMAFVSVGLFLLHFFQPAAFFGLLK